MPFSKSIQAVKSLNQDPDKFVLDIIRQKGTTDFVLSLNQKQLNGGLDANSNKIVPPYTQTTVRFKIAKGQPFDRVTLKDTGDFYTSFDIIFRNDEFQVIAKDSKRNKLRQKYGAAILGLNDGSLQELIEYMRPELINGIRKLLFA